MQTFTEFSAFIGRGGIINWIITAGYLLWMTLTLERSLFFLMTAQSQKEFFQSLDVFFSKASEEKKKRLLGKGYLSLFFRIYEENKELKDGIFNNVLVDEEENLIKKHEKNLWALSEMGHLSPLLGLLGTVTGLIKAFAAIADIGSSAEVSDLAGGIWEAMLTTANGLVLALISFLVYKIFEVLIEKRERRLIHMVTLCDKFYHKSAENRFASSTEEGNDEGFSQSLP